MVDCGSPVLLRSCPSERGTWIISLCRFELHSSDIMDIGCLFMLFFLNPQSISSLTQRMTWVRVVRVTDWISNGNMYDNPVDLHIVDHQNARGVRIGGYYVE